MLESVMLQLRTASGISVQQFASRFGQDAVRALVSAAKQRQSSGKVDVVLGDSRLDEDGDHSLPSRVCLTDPEGFLLSNDIISDLFVVLDEVSLSEV